MVRCPICKSRGFDKLNSLMKHVHSAHAGQSIFMCSVCEKTFSHSQSINRHLNNSKSCICATKISSDQWDGGKNVDIHAVIEDAGVDDVTIDTEIEKIGEGDIESRAEDEVVADTLSKNFVDDDTVPTWGPNSKINFTEWSSLPPASLSASTALRIIVKYLKPYGGTVTPSLRPLMFGMMKC